MDKKYIILILIAIILAGILISIIVTDDKESSNVGNMADINGTQIDEENNSENEIEENKIEVLATNLDELKPNSAWCGTFQLVWNDMQNEVVGQDVVFTPQLAMVENLNKQSFTENDISEEYYYKKWGLKTLELKEEIETGIKEKFDETSDILDKLDWSEAALSLAKEKYLFYTMLKREFKFENKFDELEKGTFDNKYEDIEYFGIQEGTDERIRGQVDIWYYSSEEDFAVSLITEDGDEVILIRNPEGNTFEDVYKKADEKSTIYEGIRSFGKKDTLKVPNINMDILKEYEELKNKEFPTADGKVGEIEEAMQTIQMKLDHTGGEIKSEAAITMQKTAALRPEEEESRNFNFDGKFVMFLKESTKEKPYFAVNIEDITLFQ